MRRPVRLALFDVGGTLFYDNQKLWPLTYRRAEDALWSELRAAGVKITPRELYGPYESLFSLYYGLHRSDLNEPGTARVLSDLLGRQDIHLPAATLNHALAAMYRVAQTNWQLEEDAIPTLRALRARGLRLGVLSNVANDLYTHQLIRGAGLEQYFEHVLTSVAFGRRKPDPAIFTAALAQFEAAPEAAVMIGDTYSADIEGAASVGMNTIWITRRLHERPRELRVSPDATVSALIEIPDLLG